MSTPQKLAYTVDDFAAALSISRALVYRLMRDGLIHYVVIGSDRRIPTTEAERLLREGIPSAKRPNLV